MASEDPHDERARPADGAAPGPSAPADPATEDRRPLFRDEVGPAQQRGGTSDRSTPDQNTPDRNAPDDATRVRAPATSGSMTNTRLRRVPLGEDSTQILPRTRGGSLSTSDFDRADDDAEAVPSDRTPRRHRVKLALLVAGVVAVVVTGLLVGYSVLNPPARPGASPTGSAPGPGATGAPSQSATEDPGVLLSDVSMLSAAQAKTVAPERTWKVASTQRGLDESSPQPACLGADVVLDRPEPQQTILRLLSSSGTAAPGILHQADAYTDPAEAARAFAAASRALGGCAMPGAYLESGASVSGLGDQAVAALVSVTADGRTELRSVVLNRTGRIVNVLDTAQPAKPVPLAGVAQALGAVTDVQCGDAGGRCTSTVKVSTGTPPPGGDQPGFLAAGDIPPVGPAATGWAGTVPALPDADFTGSGCETVVWAKVQARQRAARTYLLTDGNPKFGLDTIVITHSADAAAQVLAGRVKADLDSCASRKLTATVSTAKPVSGIGAGAVRVQGWTATVSQKTTAGTATYRVGVVSAGTKTVFTFLNPQQSLDLTEAAFDRVTVRAGQRATQVR